MALACKATLMINLTTELWTKNDYNVYHSAIKRCIYYYPEAPCLKKFIKTEPRTYRAICGI